MSKLKADRKIKLRTSLFYTSFFLVALLKMCERSALIEVPGFLASTMTTTATVLFVVKIILDKHKRSLLLFEIAIYLLAIGIRVAGGPTFLMVSCLAFMAMKDVNIKTVIKIDIAVKSFFLLTHAIIFAVDYLTGVEAVWDYISFSGKGTTIALYFRNPNTTGLIGTWIALDLLYLKDYKKPLDYIIPTIIAVATFAITASRTPLSIYLVYLLLQLIKDGSKLTIMQKTIYPILCIASVLMVMIASSNDSALDTFNTLTSGRVSYSVAAYQVAGIKLLPVNNEALLTDYVLDVFYIKCLVSYGIITMIIYYLPHLFMPSFSTNEQKRMSILTSIYLFSEKVIADIGYAIPYLIIADTIYNKKASNTNIEDKILVEQRKLE